LRERLVIRIEARRVNKYGSVSSRLRSRVTIFPLTLSRRLSFVVARPDFEIVLE